MVQRKQRTNLRALRETQSRKKCIQGSLYDASYILLGMRRIANLVNRFVTKRIGTEKTKYSCVQSYVYDILSLKIALGIRYIAMY